MDFYGVWVDANIHNEENSEVQDQLRNIIPNFHFFTSTDKGLDYIRKNSHKKLIVIVSGSLGENLSNKINVDPAPPTIIYTSMNGKKYVSVWAKKINFIKAIVCDSTELLQEVKKWFKYEFTKKIYIKTPTGDACMEIRMDATILELKYLLQERLGFSVSTHNILLQGKILPDSIIVPSILPDSSVIPPFMHTDFLK